MAMIMFSRVHDDQSPRPSPPAVSPALQPRASVHKRWTRHSGCRRHRGGAVWPSHSRRPPRRRHANPRRSSSRVPSRITNCVSMLDGLRDYLRTTSDARSEPARTAQPKMEVRSGDIGNTSGQPPRTWVTLFATAPRPGHLYRRRCLNAVAQDVTHGRTPAVRPRRAEWLVRSRNWPSSTRSVEGPDTNGSTDMKPRASRGCTTGRAARITVPQRRRMT
jgi:hypothetical protein